MTEQPDNDGATTPVLTIKNLAVITIYVSDLELSLQFYRHMLGFEDAEQMLSPGYTLQFGEQMVYFVGGRWPAEKELDTYPEIALCFAVSGVEEAFTRLRDAGATIVADYDKASEYFASFHIADPDGNLLMFWGRP